MEKKVKINDKEYILGSNGALVDSDGNLMGMLCSDLVNDFNVGADGVNLIDKIKPELKKKVDEKLKEEAEKNPNGINPRLVLTGSTVAAYFAIGLVLGAAYYVWDSGILDDLH